jgi:hypothetical protein
MRKRYSDTIPTFSEAFLMLEKTDEILDEHTSVLFDKLTYAIFGIALMPQNNLTITVLNRFSGMYLEVKDYKGYWSFSEDIEHLINDTYKLIKKQLPLKVGIKKAARILRAELPKNPFRNGIELGIINNLMDLRHTPYLREELPLYSRLGLGHHANKVVNEEKQLLSDSFYLLVLAEAEYEKMCYYKKSLNKPYLEEHRNDLTRFNANVCSLSRNCIVSFFAFYEAFINGVGINYIYQNKDSLSQEEIFALEGKDRH